MKKGNNFQIAKVQSQDIPDILLNFLPGAAYKSVALKRRVLPKID